VRIWVKRVTIALTALVALLIVAAGSVIALMTYFEFPGGMPPSYRATDHDARLTTIARDAAPIINAIDRFYNAHGQCPRVSEHDLAELRNALPAGFTASFVAGEIELRAANEIMGWSYYSPNKDPSACTLSCKLGWDPDLVWSRHGEQTQWIFVPGDGSDETVVDLDVGR
jgi:hypothetical protein